MLDVSELSHDFDMAWLEPLDIEQVHFLLFYLHSTNDFLCPKPGATPATSDATGVYDWDDLAFYINSHCPNSVSQPKYVFQRALENYFRLQPSTPESGWQLKYSHLTQIFCDHWLTFMNYGYYDFENRNKGIELDAADEEWRMCIQLYNRLMHGIDVGGKDLLEIGCGRGGGASFISRYKAPASYLAMDGTKTNVLFCNDAHSVSNLSFDWSLAESFDLPDESRDVVLNLESINYYRPLSDFVDNVFKVLRPSGYFLMSTMGQPRELRQYKEQIEKCGFILEEEEDVTFNVIRALEELDCVSKIIDNHDTLRQRAMYYQNWRSLYGVDGFLNAGQRYCRFRFRKP